MPWPAHLGWNRIGTYSYSSTIHSLNFVHIIIKSSEAYIISYVALKGEVSLQALYTKSKTCSSYSLPSLTLSWIKCRHILTYTCNLIYFRVFVFYHTFTLFFNNLSFPNHPFSLALFLPAYFNLYPVWPILKYGIFAWPCSLLVKVLASQTRRVWFSAVVENLQHFLSSQTAS